MKGMLTGWSHWLQEAQIVAAVSAAKGLTSKIRSPSC
jgi:hypothetical protein